MLNNVIINLTASRIKDQLLTEKTQDIQWCSFKEVLYKYEANLQENTHARK